MPKISVLIPVYNGAKFLNESILSVLRQTFTDFEIVVVDDGSTDQTKNIVEEISALFPNKIHYSYQDNQGVSLARNAAINLSQGRFLAFLDSDDYWLPNHLEEQIKVIENNIDIGLVHSNISQISEDGKFIKIPQRKKQYLSGSIFEYLFLRKANIACSTSLFRKDCCEAIGLFDPFLTKLGCEDRDYWLRIAQRFKIVYIDKVLTSYRINSQGMSKNIDNMFKARLYIVDKYCPVNGKNHRLRNQALAKIYRDLGDDYLLTGKNLEARIQYNKAIKFNPFVFRTWINFCKTFII